MCLKITEKELTQKQLVKLWLNNYLRYDTLPANKGDGKNTSMKSVMEKRTDLFKFEEDIKELNELKTFLKMMSE